MVLKDFSISDNKISICSLQKQVNTKKHTSCIGVKKTICCVPEKKKAFNLYMNGLGKRRSFLYLLD